jgi:excinuclease ABC subunit C
MTLESFKKQNIPDTPGVYFFLNKQKKILYIGKATSLVDRVRSYFSSDLITTRGKLLVNMVEEAVNIEYKTTESVLEALLLEADLIKKFRPTFNTKEKDDKSFLCIAFTREDFPRLITIRKKDVEISEKSKVEVATNTREGESRKQDLITNTGLELLAVYGPYTSGTQLKEALRIIRKIFPYADLKCVSLKSKVKSQKSDINVKDKKSDTKPPRACFNYSIGLCPGVCIGAVTKQEYAKTIRHLQTLLEGKVSKLVTDLEKEMNACAKAKEFEKASVIKNKIYALTHIHDISLIKQENISNFLHSSASVPHDFRIESFDIAHMSGGSMVGVMTVVTNSEVDKSQYRKFKVNTVKASNDTKALSEILERRLGHTEWPMPNLIVVDGGVGQLNAINAVLDKHNITIPVVSVVKDERHQPKDVLGDQTLAIRYRKEILLSNAEAHRFAIGYHKKVRNRNFLK